MKKEIKQQRLELLKRLDYLELKRCDICKGTVVNSTALNCTCPAAVEIRKIGDQLADTSRKSRKQRIADYVKQAREEGLTTDIYHFLRELELTNKEVQKLSGMTQIAFQEWRVENGLAPAPVIKKVVEAPKQKMKKPDVHGLTPEHFAIAEKNGISRNVVKTRCATGWTIERAITEEPFARRKEMRYWQEIAEKNGLTAGGFKNRLNKGMSLEDAATQPRNRHRTSTLKYDSEMLALARSNGISYATFVRRVTAYKWNQKRAATEPPRKMNGVTK